MRQLVLCVMLLTSCVQSRGELSPVAADRHAPGCLDLQIRSDTISRGMGILADSMPGSLALRLTGKPVPAARLRDSIGTLQAEFDHEYGTATGGWQQDGDSLRIRFRSIYMWSEFHLGGPPDSLRGWAASGTHRGFHEHAVVSARRTKCDL